MATGIPPDALGRLDVRSYEALGHAAVERWTMLEELAAQQVEYLDRVCALLVVQLGRRASRPYVVQRPAAIAEAAAASSGEKIAKATPRQLAELLSGGRGRG